MTFGDKLGTLFGRERREQLSASALEQDSLRDAIIREAEPEVPRFEQMMQACELPGAGSPGATWETFPELARDVARAAVQYDEPKVRGRDKMLPSHALNREVLNQMLGTEQMREVRRHSVGDAHDALFSTLALQDAINKHASELAEHVDRANEANGVEQKLSSAEETLEQLRDAAMEFADAPQPERDRLDKDLVAQEHMVEHYQQRLADIDQANSGSTVADVAQKIAKHATGKAAGQLKALGQLAGIAPGADGSKDPAQRIAMAEQWSSNDKLKRIIEEAGRLARTMKFARAERTKNVPIQPVGIVGGNHIPRLLPHELAGAHAPDLRALWAKRYGQRALLEYKMDGKEPANKGPIICVKDGSGSMSRDQRIEHATAVELACLSVAAREKRAFAAVEFGGSNQSRTEVFPAGQVDGAKVLAWASHFFHSSGTDISAGMAAALRVILEHGAFKNADVILMTDGQCSFTERDQVICAELRSLGVKIHGISIAAPNNRYLQQACDWHVELADLAGETTDLAVRLASELS